MDTVQKIDNFLSSPAFAVAGASVNRHKFGNKLLRCYLQNGRQVFPLNPVETEIEGLLCCSKISLLPLHVLSISMVTPPAVTLKLTAEAIEHGIKNIWMQPGAEHPEALELCEKSGVSVIADGSCLLVVLGYSDH